MDQSGTTSDGVAVSSGNPCPLCGLVLGPKLFMANGQAICGACAGRIGQELEAERGGWNEIPLAAAGGAVGAALGAAVWAGIVVATNFEVGYVAVLVGFLSGMGVKFGAGKGRGQGLQITAALLAVGGLVFAKYLIFAWMVSQAATAQGQVVAWYDPVILQMFPRMIVQLSSPFDLLWIFIAVSAAYRVPAPTRVSIVET